MPAGLVKRYRKFMDIYREEILDHYKNPRNWGAPKANEKGMVKTEGSNSHCGDRVTMWAKLKNGRIEAIKFKAEGCAICVAATSKLTEALKGKKLAEAKKLKPEAAEALLGIKLSLARQKCARLGFAVWQELQAKLI
jgi:nitrogen fixation NifU-like protein